MKLAWAALLVLLSVLIPTAEWAGTATTNLSVNIQPVGVVCCSPPAAAVAAGMTTMAFAVDFTSPIPNTVGTGLPSNTPGGGNCYGGPGCWLGCVSPQYPWATNDNFPHVLYEPTVDYSTAPCDGTAPNSYVRQVTDPAYGNLALDIAAGVNRDNGAHDGGTSMSSYVRDPTDPSTQNLFTDFPMSMFRRVTFRSNTNTGGNAGFAGYPNGNLVDFWTWTAAWYATNIANYCGTQATGYTCSPVQVDDIEDWGTNSNWGAQHNYNSGVSGGVGGGSPGYDQSKYVTIDTLTTTNGNSDVQTCTWITSPDNNPAGPVFEGCSPFPGVFNPIGSQSDNSGTWATRQVLVWWVGTYNNVTPPELPIHAWVKTWQVWTCADWKRGSTGPNPYCFGQQNPTTGADGSKYYKVVTQ